MIIRLIKHLKRINPFSFILIGFSLILFISIIMGLIFPGDSGKNPILLKNNYYIFFFGVLVTPLLETLIFQALPFYLTTKYIKIKKRHYIFILLSPVLFIHNFSIGYIITTYLFGFIFAFLYYIAYYRKENAIKLVALIHFINNLLVFTVRYLG